MTEEVNCLYCGRDTAITETTQCRCGVMLHQTQELRLMAESLERQIIALRLEQGKAVSELCRRERLRLHRQGRGQTSPGFWHNVQGKPNWAGQGKSAMRRRPEPDINMADFT